MVHHLALYLFEVPSPYGHSPKTNRYKLTLNHLISKNIPEQQAQDQQGHGGGQGGEEQGVSWSPCWWTRY